MTEHTNGSRNGSATLTLDQIKSYQRQIIMPAVGSMGQRKLLNASVLLNDACYFLKKPLVDGGIFRFEGQATVYLPGKGCYRCLYPAPPPPGAVPSCAEAGVLGVLPGIIGSIQAVETIKLILDEGEPLVNRLLLFDSLAMEFREVRLRRDPNCPVCGDEPTITELIDYEAFCGGPAALHLS